MARNCIQCIQDFILAAKLAALLVLNLLLKERYFTQIRRHRVIETRAASDVDPDPDHKPEHVVSTSWLNMTSCPGHVVFVTWLIFILHQVDSKAEVNLLSTILVLVTY